MRRIAESLNAVKHNFVDALDEGPLIERCVAAMDKHLGAEAPKLASGTRGGERIGEYWRALTAREADTAKLDKTADACLHGMVDKLDRRTEYMDRERFRELMVGAQGAAGIGLEMEVIDGSVTVVMPIEGAPAERADIRAGDRLLEIDGVSTAGKTLDDVVKLMRGRKGAPIVLSVSRDGGTPMRREVVRDIIRVNTVKWRVLEGKLLYVRASQFADRTLDLFRQALEKGRAEAGAGFSGVILDLRGNPGGLFLSCIGMS